MSEEQQRSNPTIALSTRLEEDYVSPLTAIRGALEILRDFPDLARTERAQFVEMALRGCNRLEEGVRNLADSVYRDEPLSPNEPKLDLENGEPSSFIDRIHFYNELDIVEIDFTNFRFADSDGVNKFYDFIDSLIEGTKREWYFIVNYRGCTVWPEAWVAFAHRGKKVNTAYSLGTVRYAEPDTGEDSQVAMARIGASDPDILESREAAVARVEEMKRIRTASDGVE